MSEFQLFVVYSISSYLGRGFIVHEFFTTRKHAEKYIGNIDIPNVHMFNMAAEIQLSYELGQDNEIEFSQEAIRILWEEFDIIIKDLKSSSKSCYSDHSINIVEAMIKELNGRYLKSII